MNQIKSANTDTTQWTREQLAAITTSGCNLLVAAAAGSGKTAVLVERIIRKITDPEHPVDIDRLLVVTFTNAAATEMRERIGDAIIKALDRNPESKQLQKQLALLHRASITTIHSFCLDVIKNHFHRIDLDPNFRIADDTEAVLLKMDALEELFEEKYDEEHLTEEFIQLVECYGGSRDDRMLQDMVFTLHSFVQSDPWPRLWLHRQTEQFNLDEDENFGNTLWGRELLKGIRIELEGLLNQMENAVKIICNAEGLLPYQNIYQDDMGRIKGLLDKCHEDGSWDGLYHAFSDIEFARLPRCGKDVDVERQEQVKAIRDETKKQLKKIRDEVITSNSRDIIADLKVVYPLLKCLADLVMEFDDRYIAKKREKALLDFNDLEHLCLKILVQEDVVDYDIPEHMDADMDRPHLRKGDLRPSGFTEADVEELQPSEVALALRDRFEEILVDEYQDSNMVQEVLIQMISRKDTEHPNVFMVGDVKQSIYRFRQAKPELFLNKYHTYLGQDEGQGNNEPIHLSRKIQLYKNFRSRKEVIDSVNFIFKQVMSEKIGELDYNEEEALNLGAQFEEVVDADTTAGGETELHIIDLKGFNQAADTALTDDEQDEESVAGEETLSGGDEGGGEDSSDERPDHIQVEARIVAQRIKELTDHNEDNGEKAFVIYDKKIKDYRPVTYRDIVILLRTTRNWAEVFVDELTQQGIPVYADTGTGYFMTLEVQTVIALLQVIDNPMQDIPLLAVLRSPIVSITPEELVDIRVLDREVSLYEALKKLVGEESVQTELIQTAVKEKALQFLEKLARWRMKAAYMATDELIWYLYTDTGYYSFVAAMPGGMQRQANLRILFERAKKYEETSFKGLFNFINFLNKLKKSQGDMGSAKILGENENVVKMMSIHKSKGLEFPVVIVAGAGKGFNLQDLNKSILLHQDLGFGPDFVDYRKRISYPTVAKQALRYKIKLESLSEEMRILYVALTRAKEKLIIVGAVRDVQKSGGKWCASLDIPDKKLPAFLMLRGKSYLDWIGPALMRHNACNLYEKIFDRQGYKINEVDDPSQWMTRIWHKEDLIAQADKEENEGAAHLLKAQSESVDTEYSSEIARRLEWEYVHKISHVLPVKLSVTELKRHFNTEFADEYLMTPVLQDRTLAMKDETVPENDPAGITIPALIQKPSFLEERNGLTSAERGTALHFVMQHLDFGKVSSVNEIREQIDGMVLRELLTEQQAKSVNVNKIKKFFESTLGKRLLAAGHVYREVPFNIELKCTDLYRDLPAELYKEEKVLLQGVIDCYFEEDDELILVDYKTDYVAASDSVAASSHEAENSEDIIRNRYGLQIEYYSRALAYITGKRVRERCIYLFWNDRVIDF